METASLSAEQRRYLRKTISDLVRGRTKPPAGYACAECGADLRDLPGPVQGCTTCANRYWRRRQRASR